MDAPMNMLETARTALKRQYHASLEMLAKGLNAAQTHTGWTPRTAMRSGRSRITRSSTRTCICNRT